MKLTHKGRLNVGADADLVIFDPQRISDEATFMEPTLPPVGIERVYIGGRLAAREGKILQGKLGWAVRA